MLQFHSRLGTWFTRPGPTATSCSGDPPKQVGLERLHDRSKKLQVVVFSSIPDLQMLPGSVGCRPLLSASPSAISYGRVLPGRMFRENAKAHGLYEKARVSRTCGLLVV